MEGTWRGKERKREGKGRKMKEIREIYNRKGKETGGGGGLEQR